MDGLTSTGSLNMVNRMDLMILQESALLTSVLESSFPYQLCEQFIPYIGIGPSFSRIWLKNKPRCSHDTISKWAVGGVLKTGVYYCINRYVFMDIFVDYLYQPVHFEKHVDIGGVKVGLGIGAKF